jgi:hypothetical protein
MYQLRVTLVYFLILTVISSVLAFTIVVKAYENAYDGYVVE